MNKIKASIIIILLSNIAYLIMARPVLADPQPSSSSFQLLDYGFGAGGTATSSSHRSLRSSGCKRKSTSFPALTMSATGGCAAGSSTPLTITGSGGGTSATAMTTLITIPGYIITGLMAIGAVFGALNTMYSSVAARTREIATLRALGFGRGAVVVSVMLEALALALVGGAAGAGVAYFVFNGFETATMNWQSFSQVTFAFRVTPALLAQGVVLATLIGLLGGLLPALRAARQPIAVALREL